MLLANFYFWYFAAVSVFIAFFNIYVKHLGFTSFEISLLAALHPLARVLWPPLWGHLADRTGRRDLVAAAVNLAATAVFGAYFFADRFLSLLLVQLVFTFFWSSVLPLMEATSLEQASLGRIDYGRSRMWGSVGFILASLAIGRLLDRLGIGFALWTILGCLFLSALSTLFSPRPETTHASQPGSLRIFLRRREVRLFFLVGMLCQLSHATMYNFLSIHLEAVGYSNNLIGILWAFGVACEVPVIRWSSRLIDRFGRLHLMTFALFVAVVRWLIMSLTTAYPVLLFAPGNARRHLRHVPRRGRHARLLARPSPPARPRAGALQRPLLRRGHLDRDARERRGVRPGRRARMFCGERGRGPGCRPALAQAPRKPRCSRLTGRRRALRKRHSRVQRGGK